MLASIKNRSTLNHGTKRRPGVRPKGFLLLLAVTQDVASPKLVELTVAWRV